jgi:fructoselysine-6-P-deglycase FrlB-like protein
MEEHEGLRRMQAEMDRQRADALATLEEVAGAAAAAAASARRTGRVALVAMGGSHHVNAVVAPLYRGLGLDCAAWTASDLLLAPLPAGPRTWIVVSQSGRSGEIVEWLRADLGRGDRFALTLDGASPLAEASAAALVAHGGPEQAFAATRSITLTLAMHGAVLGALGMPLSALRAAYSEAASPPIDAVDARLAGADAVIFAGYDCMAGVAASAALSMMELARVVTVGFDGGQFRHGPFEVLRPGLGVVLFRGDGPDEALIPPIARATLDAGCATVVVDASGRPPVDGAVTLGLPPGGGLAAAARMLLAMQPLNIAVARRRVPQAIGTPLRTTKVTV